MITKLIYSLIFISFSLFGFSQTSPNNFNKRVYRLVGDLNNDNLNDLVIVKANTDDKTNPFLLEIKFQNKKGAYNTVILTTKAVMPKFPYGDERTELILEKLQIKKGVLIFTNQMIRGSLVHKFRYQNKSFELIGYTYNNASPGYIEHLDYNLSTGIKISKQLDYQTNKVIKHSKTKEKLADLPKLKDFSPFDFMY